MIKDNVRYELWHDKDPQGRTSYGIAVCDAQDPKKILDQIKDITPDRQKLSELVELCNRLDLAYIHLANVVEDFFH